ncbi:MAG: hypothetical protein GY801_40760 [bacterium]|nr:hypothetical protein [bacterium]
MVDWTGAVYALQAQLSLNVHVGGKTALEIKGYAHYLSDLPKPWRARASTDLAHDRALLSG